MTQDADNRAFVEHAQRRLTTSGDYTGRIDGWGGQATRRAFDAAMDRAVQLQVAKTAVVVPAVPARPVVRFVGPRQTPEEMTRVYGPAGGIKCTAGRVSLPVPFLFRVDKPFTRDWYACHELLAPAMTSLWAHVHDHYGEYWMMYWGMTEFGGCYNFRPMRNSTGNRLSTHAWGAAVDVDPQKNQLSWGRDRARLAQPDCEPFWRIVEAHGAVSLGRQRNFDWMHFQFAQL